MIWCCLAATAAIGQAPAKDAKPPVAGHSHFGPAFNEGPRQAAKLLSGQGRVVFPATSTNADAKKFVVQGVGQLHGFWYWEAERSFRQAALLDPDCAIAYWGMAMANVSNRTRAKGFIAEAAKRKAKASPRETRYIDAYNGFYAGDKPDKERYRNLVRALEDLSVAHPDDVEAKAFLALALWSANQDMPINSTLAAEAVCGQVYAAEPYHPAHHFSIHLWDTDGRAERALGSAAKCGESAPGIAHMWHMPGHIYDKLKRYPEASWQFEASARVDHAAMTRDRVMPYEIHNYSHNNQWLSQDLAKQGRVAEALAVARDLAWEPRHPKLNRLDNGSSSAGFGRRRFTEACAEYELWDALLAECQPGKSLTFADTLDDRLLKARLLGAAAFAKNDLASGDAQIAAAEACAKEIEPKPAANKTTEKAAADKAKGPKAPERPKAKFKAKGKGGDKPNDDARATEVLAELRARRAAATGQFAEALKLAEKAKQLSKATTIRWHGQAGDKAKAVELARAFVGERTNDVLPLATLTAALVDAGKWDEAATEFDKLATLAGRADPHLPIFARLKPLLERLEISGDWRTPTPFPADFGKRPQIETLGPLAFESWSVPDWIAPAVTGERIDLAELRKRKRAVLVLYYLGSGCVHCVEQMKAFAPLVSEFAKENIAVVAVSTEDREKLADSLKTLAVGEKAPFPLVPDPTFTLFKQASAYDDFEKMPLHGVFLISPAGKVLWRDVGFEPFADAKFLLEEAKRLLGRKVG